MKKIDYDGQFFSVKDTLSCGQIFRYAPYKDGFLVFSGDKCCYAYNNGGKAIIECDIENEKYFYDYFDLERDYNAIYRAALEEKEEIIRTSATLGKGIRILNQNKTETLFSFIVSQNNNIPRIKKILNGLCEKLGEERSFDGVKFYSFPTAEKMAEKPIEFFTSTGLGYRAGYIKKLADDIVSGFDPETLSDLSTKELRKELVGIYGVGPKVADCVTLFGYHRADSFPVDIWIEKVYAENFNGTIKERNKISEYFLDRFKDNSGYYQQYLFYYKRSLENK